MVQFLEPVKLLFQYCTHGEAPKRRAMIASCSAHDSARTAATACCTSAWKSFRGQSLNVAAARLREPGSQDLKPAILRHRGLPEELEAKQSESLLCRERFAWSAASLRKSTAPKPEDRSASFARACRTKSDAESFAGRGDWIRTSDLRFPKPPRYQAAPRPAQGGVKV